MAVPMQHSTNLQEFPFRSVLSLRPLVQYWEDAITSGSLPSFTHSILKEIQAAPELKQPIADPLILERHKSLIHYLISAAIPPSQTDNDLIAATVPFKFESFYATKAFEE